MKTRILLFALSMIVLQHNQVSAQTLVKNMSSTNGDVYSVYKKGGAYYIGGSFTYVGLNTGYAALTQTNNDYPDMNFPAVNGAINTIVPDGNGGWFIGGAFSAVGNTARSNIAHVKSDNTVDGSFNASCNGRVRAILRIGSKLYIGGDFTLVNSSTQRFYAAAVNANTGGVIAAWNPAPNGPVYTISPVFKPDTTLWLGGNFSKINTDVNRTFLVKVNSTNGNFINGTINTNGIVNKLLTRGDSVFVAGNYTTFGLRTDYLSSIPVGSNVADQTMPVTNGAIRAIIPDGAGGWYVAGQFTQIGGVSRSYVARVNANRTVNPNFNVTSNGYVYALALDGNKLYLGGSFSVINNTTRNYIAAVNANNGVLQNWDPNASLYVYTLALTTNDVLAGGIFTTIGSKWAYRFAAISKTTGTAEPGFVGYNNQLNKISVRGDSILTAGNYGLAGYYTPNSAKITTTNVIPDYNFPATNGIIRTVLPDGNGNYYVGGSFTTIGGINQPYIAKLNSSFQVITAWAPGVNGEVRSIALNSSTNTVYIGGLFTSTNGVSRPYISALSTGNPGNNKTWNSTLNSYVYSLAFDGTNIYAGGEFYLVNGNTTRNRVAKFNTNGALDATWNPDANAAVNQVALSGSNVLIGGNFTSIAGNTSRTYLAKLNNTTGAAVNWATANNQVYALYVDGNTCYVGGAFTQLSTTSKLRLGAVNISNGNIGSFAPDPDNYVWSISKSGNILYYGGYFKNVNNTPRNYLAASNVSNSSLQSWNPSPNFYVFNINLSGTDIILGGQFSGFQEVSRTYASAIKNSTGALLPWAPPLNGLVNDITYNSSRIFIGGQFTMVSNSQRNGFATFTLNGNLNTFNLNLSKTSGNVTVNSLLATETQIYAGGDFEKSGATTRRNLVGANLSPFSVTATDPGPDANVYDIDLNGSTLVYGGAFTFSNNIPRNYLGVINGKDGVALPWNPSPDSYVFDIAYNYNRIFAVGQFDNVANTPHTGAVAFNLSNGNLLSWNPQLSRSNNGVYADLTAVLADSNNVYLGGNFDKVNTTARNNAAIVSATNASPLSWNTGPDDIVRTIGKSDTKLILGGDFKFCKGAARRYAAKIDSATGLVSPSWTPEPNSYVWAITGNGNNIYLGGQFTQLAGITRTALGAVNANTGALQAFDPVVRFNTGTGYVYTLAFDASNILYVGGYFNNVKGGTRNYLAALGISAAGSLRPWNPNASDQVNAIAVNGSTIFVGGNFTTLNGGTTRNKLASVDNVNGTLTTFNPNIGSNVNALSLSNNNILYVGGQFSTVNGSTARSYLAAYNTTTGNLAGWNPGASGGYVYGLAAATDTVYIGGNFSIISGTARVRLGAVKGSAGSSLLGPFNPNANNVVRNNYISEHTLLCGGAFTLLNGIPRGGFAVYTLPRKTFAVGSNDYVKHDILQPKLIHIYPNPASTGVVNIQLNEKMSGRVTVVLTDMKGKPAFTKTFETFTGSKTIQLNVSSLLSGSYSVNIIGRQNSLTERLEILK